MPCRENRRPGQGNEIDMETGIESLDRTGRRREGQPAGEDQGRQGVDPQGQEDPPPEFRVVYRGSQPQIRLFSFQSIHRAMKPLLCSKFQGQPSLEGSLRHGVVGVQAAPGVVISTETRIFFTVYVLDGGEGPDVEETFSQGLPPLEEEEEIIEDKRGKLLRIVVVVAREIAVAHVTDLRA